MNPYEQQREDRIRRNNAMLEKLQLRQQADKLAAPMQAAAEAEAKKQADIRANIAAVEPRQRSTRGSAAQAKAALSKQALAMSGDSDDASDASGDSSEAEGLSDGGMGSARSKKRKADAEEEDDYDPLEDHLDVQDADGSASDAEDNSAASSDALDSDVETVPKPSSRRGQRQRDSKGAKRQSRGGRGKKAAPAPARGEQSGSEEDDFELQQALAMSLLERQQPSAQNSCPEVPAPAQPEAASAHAEPAAGQAARKEPGTATLQEEHIEAATTESRLRREQEQSAGAAILAASASKADAAQDTSAAAEAEMQGTKKSRAQAGSGQKGRKQPAKGKAIEICDLGDIGRAYDMICSGTGTIREHHLQQVWSEVRGGNLDKLACNNMLTYAADITGEGQLDRAAFMKLCEHFR